MNNEIKKIIGYVFIALCAASAFIFLEIVNKNKNTQSILVQMAESINKGLPAMLDSETRNDSVIAGPGLNFTYVITFVSYPTASVDESTQNFLRKRIEDNYCRTSVSSQFSEYRVKVNYNIKANDGGQIVKFKIDPNYCESQAHLKG